MPRRRPNNPPLLPLPHPSPQSQVLETEPQQPWVGAGAGCEQHDGAGAGCEQHDGAGAACEQHDVAGVSQQVEPQLLFLENMPRQRERKLALPQLGAQQSETAPQPSHEEHEPEEAGWLTAGGTTGPPGPAGSGAD